jgi:hypothetical protein
LTQLRRKVSLEEKKRNLGSQYQRWLQRQEKELSKQRHLEINHPEDEAIVSLDQDWSTYDLNRLLERSPCRGVRRRGTIGRFQKFQLMIATCLAILYITLLVIIAQDVSIKSLLLSLFSKISMK